MLRSPWADGRRLAKRDGSIKFATLREAGVDPRLLIGAMVNSCGWSDAIAPMTPNEAIAYYSAAQLPAQAWIVTPEWLEQLHQGG